MFQFIDNIYENEEEINVNNQVVKYIYIIFSIFLILSFLSHSVFLKFFIVMAYTMIATGGDIYYTFFITFLLLFL